VPLTTGSRRWTSSLSSTRIDSFDRPC